MDRDYILDLKKIDFCVSYVTLIINIPKSPLRVGHPNHVETPE